MTSSKRLQELQEIDSLLYSKRESLANVRARLGDNRASINAQNALQAATKQLQEYRANQRDIEAEVEDVREKANQVEKRLYSGTILNPRELSAMQDELGYLRSRQKQKEDSLLECLVQVEEAQDSYERSRATFEEVQSRREKEVSELTVSKGQLEATISELEAQRESSAGAIEGSSLSLYERLRKSKKGQAVARVGQNTCQGCRISLPSKVMQQIRGGQGLVQCNSCGRILHMS